MIKKFVDTDRISREDSFSMMESPPGERTAAERIMSASQTRRRRRIK